MFSMQSALASSFLVGKIWGIRVRIHFSFALLLFILGLLATVQEGVVYGLATVFFLLVLFFLVLLHELGHCWMAIKTGARVRDILLWPLGGLAFLEGVSSDPNIRIKIALAGPMVNITLAILLCPFAVISEGAFFLTLIKINLLIGFFNLLPAFPILDGGHIYHAFLSKKWGTQVATVKALDLGQKLALILGVIGLFYNFWLVFIAVLIYFAGQEKLQKQEAERFFSSPYSQSPTPKVYGRDEWNKFVRQVENFFQNRRF